MEHCPLNVRALPLALLVLSSLSSAHAAPTAAYAPPPGPMPSVSTQTELGRQLFMDPSLSASGRLACVSCHSPAHAYGPPDGASTRRGGADMKQVGARAVPSLRYIQTVPAFTEHFFDDDGNDSIDKGVTGGLTWDGRVNSAHDQVRIPITAAHEMANRSPAEFVARLRKARYAEAFRSAYGDAVFRDDAAAFRWATMSLEVFLQNPSDFQPFTSKFDAYEHGRAKLSTQELHGLALFNDPRKGNCASCHPSTADSGRAYPLFTDFGFNALGVPRNAAIPANANPQHYDMGLCGPDRTDLARRAEYCGFFRTPSLRNVATRRVFFHNGAYHTLTDAIRFYAQRDSRPEHIYPRDRSGRVQKFDDLPPALRKNVNQEPPFGRKPGQADALSADEIRDIAAFLGTLTDGYLKQHP